MATKKNNIIYVINLYVKLDSILCNLKMIFGFIYYIHPLIQRIELFVITFPVVNCYQIVWQNQFAEVCKLYKHIIVNNLTCIQRT